MKKVLIIGTGGREHALAWKFSTSPQVSKVYVANGNANMKDVAEIVNIGVNEFDKLAEFAINNSIDLTFVGPEVPLVNGIVDYFEEKGLCIFGPRKNAAIIEGSKSFCKDIMHRYDIPTANYAILSDYNDACAYAKKQHYPLVIKADGLAAGKGVVIVETYYEAEEALKQIMLDKKFFEAGMTVVIEEFLVGEEFSLFAFVNGDKVYPMQIAQDHKKVFDGDFGPNTGGMGAYTPVTHIQQVVIDEAMNNVMIPMAKAMVAENRPYVGILYGGLMITKNGVKTIEFNCRFGDPETEVLLQAIVGDIYQVVIDVIDGKTPTYTFNSNYYLGVVMAANGYPEEYVKGSVIEGIIETAPNILHMGTDVVDNKCVSNGGRVLFVSGSGVTIDEAIKNAYTRVEKIKSDGLFYRKDIGFRAILEEDK